MARPNDRLSLSILCLAAVIVVVVIYNSYTAQDFRFTPDVPDLVESSVPPLTNNTPTPDNKMHIVLYTEGRSGSTWLSSFFWNHPNVFYSFEPTRVILGNPECHNGSKSMRICNTELFQRLFVCNFHERNVLGRYPTGYHNNCIDCSTIPKLESFCHTTTHIVPKLIWMKDLRDIEEVMSDPQFNVKVVHLVRDARPLVMSRANKGFGSLDGINPIHARDGALTEQQLYDQSGTLCERILRAGRLGDNPPEWFKGRYMRISHEQLTVDPIKIAKKIYEFSHLPWNDAIEDFIYKTTIGAIGKTGQFGIGRISATMTEKWKKTIKPEWLPIITKACKPMLEYYGYPTDLEEIEMRKQELLQQDREVTSLKSVSS